jgi:hypothetical protein
MIKKIVLFLTIIIILIQELNCLRLKSKKVSISRQKRVPDAQLLISQMSSEFGNSAAQMIICKNRFDCVDFCRKYSSGLLFNKSEMPFASDVMTDAHKLGLQLGRRNDCDKCGLIYAHCDDKYFNSASKLWSPASDNKFTSGKAKNQI